MADALGRRDGRCPPAAPMGDLRHQEGCDQTVRAEGYRFLTKTRPASVRRTLSPRSSIQPRSTAWAKAPGVVQSPALGVVAQHQRADVRAAACAISRAVTKVNVLPLNGCRLVERITRERSHEHMGMARYESMCVRVALLVISIERPNGVAKGRQLCREKPCLTGSSFGSPEDSWFKIHCRPGFPSPSLVFASTN
jgi:hypothetical protein